MTTSFHLVEIPSIWQFPVSFESRGTHVRERRREWVRILTQAKPDVRARTGMVLHFSLCVLHPLESYLAFPSYRIRFYADACASRPRLYTTLRLHTYLPSVWYNFWIKRERARIRVYYAIVFIYKVSFVRSRMRRGTKYIYKFYSLNVCVQGFINLAHILAEVKEFIDEPRVYRS